MAPTQPLPRPCPPAIAALETMSRPADWILSFKSTIDNGFTASLAKLRQLFDGNPEWIKDQQQRLRRQLELEEKEGEAEAEAAMVMAKFSRVAPGAAVKKPRGRPKKEKIKADVLAVLHSVYYSGR